MAMAAAAHNWLTLIVSGRDYFLLRASMHFRDFLLKYI